MANFFKIQFLAKNAEQKMQAIIAAGTSTRAFEVVGQVLVNRIRLCFKFGIDPWQSPWAKLKIRKGQPLVDTGLLRRSVVSRADNSGVTVGTNKLQARVHQFGATIEPKKAKRLVFPGPGGAMIFAKKVTIPARPFLPIKPNTTGVALPPAWSIDVVRSLRRYFQNATKNAGG